MSSRSSGQAIIYFGFAMTGVALTLPGALLPVLLRRWGLGDARGGLLLFCFFLASSAGALLARGRMDRRVALGAAVTTLGAIWLMRAGHLSGFAAMSVYGLGLGLTMTAISLLQSRRFPAERRLIMTRLNLVWAAGAVAGPWLALHGWRGTSMSRGAFVTIYMSLAQRFGWGRSGALGRSSPWGYSGAVPGQAAWWAVAAFFAAFALWMRWMQSDPRDGISWSEAGPTQGPSRWALAQVPWPLLVLLFCATGVEAAAGGWLTAFAQRNADTLGTTIGAATMLWAGLLVGRALHSTAAAARLAEWTVLLANSALMAAALALLIAWPAGAVTIAAAAVLGFAAAPVYPLLLAMTLRERETAAIFVVAGSGSSLLPLATGVMSGATHSLRAGLGVPLVATLGMTALVQFAAVEPVRRRRARSLGQ